VLGLSGNIMQEAAGGTTATTEDAVADEKVQDGPVDDAIVVHEDLQQAASRATGQSVEDLVWQSSPDLAKAVTLFGSGVLTLPLFARIIGIPSSEALAYSAHPRRASGGGILDRGDLERKFGKFDPESLMSTIKADVSQLEAHIQGMNGEQLRAEVLQLQEWRAQASARMKTLERRAACAVLGLPRLADVAAVRYAFKKKALALHPDKGGDVNKFKLLQEMKDLLLEHADPNSKGKTARSEEQADEGESAKKSNGGDKKEKREADAQAAKRDSDTDDDWFNESDFSDQDFYDANEEFRKMFPRRKKKTFRRSPGYDDEEETSANVSAMDVAVERPKLEAMRRKIQTSMVEMLSHTDRLVADIGDAEERTRKSSDILRSLQRFLDRFAKFELSKLKAGDVRAAERLFRTFLEHGCEVLCAAGAVDPAGTVAEVAMKINLPLLAQAKNPSLEARCANLLEAINSLPQASDMLARHYAEVRALVAKEPKKCQQAEGKENAAPQTSQSKAEAECTRQASAGNAPDKSDDEDWFDDFFDGAKQAADAQRQKERDDAQQRVEEEVARRKAQEAAEEEKRASLKKAAKKRQGAAEVNKAKEESKRKPVRQDDSFQLAQAKPEKQHLEKLRECWDAAWSHPCAGERRADGSAIFCFPCDDWVATITPFDERGFDLHCTQEGHTDWID